MEPATVTSLVAPVVASCGLEVDRVEVLPAGKRRVVRIYLDGDGPEGVMRALDEAERVLSPLASDRDAHRAHVMLGRLHQRRGRTAEAESAYMLLIDAFNDERIGERDSVGLSLVGMAAWGLGSPHDANDAFRDAIRADEGLIEARLEWAKLFFAKYDTGHAEELVR